MGKNLHLFTDNFPYGKGESYLNNEIPYLSEKMGNVFIYPYVSKGKVTATIDGGFETRILRTKKKYKLGIKDFYLAFKIHLIEFFNAPKKLDYLKRIRYFQAQIREAVSIADTINSSNSFIRTDIYYSYWMNIYALALAILKERNIIENFVFRVNGFDVYDERHDGNYLPFRKFIYSQTEKVICVSKAAMNYIKEKNIYPHKIDYSYFGTEDFGIKTHKQRKELVLFSCSSIIPLKRVELIADVLKKVKTPVIWVHHGSGIAEESLLKRIEELPSNIEFRHSKYLPRYYDVLMLEKELAPDLFVSLSETEGLPVTMMEAISMGIPILATDVGGCNEIVNRETGLLVSKDFEFEEIATLISNFKESRQNSLEFSNGAREFWLNNFQARENYKAFALYLKQVFE